MNDQMKQALHQAIHALLPQIGQALLNTVEQALAPHMSQAAGAMNTAPQQQAFGNPQGMQGAPGGAQHGSVMGVQTAPNGGNPQSQIGGAAGNMFGTAQAQPATSTPSVTPDMIQQLITPLVQNEQIKAALTAQMQAMGIQNLPDARPEQLPELYQRFQNVQQQAQAAGLLGGGNAAPSII